MVRYPTDIPTPASSSRMRMVNLPTAGWLYQDVHAYSQGLAQCQRGVACPSPHLTAPNENHRKFCGLRLA